MYQKKSGCGPFAGFIVLVATIFAFIFISPQGNNSTVNSAGWYQSVENIIAPIGHSLDQRFGPSKKGGSIKTSAGVMSWR